MRVEWVTSPHLLLHPWVILLGLSLLEKWQEAKKGGAQRGGSIQGSGKQQIEAKGKVTIIDELRPWNLEDLPSSYFPFLLVNPTLVYPMFKGFSCCNRIYFFKI